MIPNIIRTFNDFGGGSIESRSGCDGGDVFGGIGGDISFFVDTKLVVAVVVVTKGDDDDDG